MPLKMQTDEQFGLNLTPMIDVLFLLIIFFMVATKFSELERDIDLRLPEVANADNLSSQPKMREISVYSNGELALDGRPLTLKQLRNELTEARQQRSDLTVVIRGDASCEYRHVTAALALCKEARVRDVSVSVRLAGADVSRR